MRNGAKSSALPTCTLTSARGSPAARTKFDYLQGRSSLQEAVIKDYDVSTWYVIFGPAGMPSEVVNSLNAEILKALKFRDVQEGLINAGIGEIVGSTPAEATKFVRAEYERWAKVIKVAHITVE